MFQRPAKKKTYPEFGIVQLEPSALRQIIDMFEGETAMLIINEYCNYSITLKGRPDIIYTRRT